MTKARVSTVGAAVTEAFGQAHVSIFATHPDEVSDEIVMEKVSIPTMFTLKWFTPFAAGDVFTMQRIE